MSRNVDVVLASCSCVCLDALTQITHSRACDAHIPLTCACVFVFSNVYVRLRGLPHALPCRSRRAWTRCPVSAPRPNRCAPSTRGRGRLHVPCRRLPMPTWSRRKWAPACSTCRCNAVSCQRDSPSRCGVFMSRSHLNCLDQVAARASASDTLMMKHCARPTAL